MTSNCMALNWAERAHKHFPAGSNGEYDLPHDLVCVFKRGNGCHVWDSEDRMYYDYTMAWGSGLSERSGMSYINKCNSCH